MPLGAHLPTSKGFEAALAQARGLGCDCLQIFSKSPRQWDAAPLDRAKVDNFRRLWQQSELGPLVAHDSFLINLAAPDKTMRARSIAAMIDEVERAEALGCDFLVTHCGAHLQPSAKPKARTKTKPLNSPQNALFANESEAQHNDQTVAFRDASNNRDASHSDTGNSSDALDDARDGLQNSGLQNSDTRFSESESEGSRRLADSLFEVLEATPDARVRIALENTAGQGTCLGGPFEHLARVLGALKSPRLGVCFDTCHAFAAGHDISTEKGLEQTLRHFDSTIGLEHLAVIHFNDSKGELGGHLDRHEHIGQGRIGRDGMARIVNHPRLRHLPFILETPDVETMIAVNLDAVRAMKNKHER